MTLEEAKELMTEESLDKLKSFVISKPAINTSNKVGNDILMQAFCAAVSNNVIKLESLDDRLVKLLNSATNTLSSKKVSNIITKVQQMQPKMRCVIRLLTADMSDVVGEWVFVGPSVSFNGIFEFVINHFGITPNDVRTKMVDTLKPTIVNNVSQLVANYLSKESTEDLNISITTINRLVNMESHILTAEFLTD